MVTGIMWLASIIGTGPAAGLPPPIEQAGADCTAPSYASDQLVCSTPDLLALDREMRAVLDHVSSAAVAPISPYLEAQGAWLRRRSMCAMRANHGQCLQQAYRERIAVLQGLANSAKPEGQTFACSNAGPVQRATLDRATGGAFLFDQAGRISAVAFPIGKDKGGWRPFLIVTSKRRSVTITPLNGLQLNCSTSRPRSADNVAE